MVQMSERQGRALLVLASCCVLVTLCESRVSLLRCCSVSNELPSRSGGMGWVNSRFN